MKKQYITLKQKIEAFGVFIFVVWCIEITAQVPEKTLYVEFFNYSILGNQQREDNLIFYANSRNFNSLILFGTGETFHYDEVQDSPLLSYENELVNFVNKAKASGINKIGIAVGDNWSVTYKQANAVDLISGTQFLSPDDGIWHPAVSGDNQISGAINLPFLIKDLEGNTVNQIFVSTNGFVHLQDNLFCTNCYADYLVDPGSNTKNIVAGLWNHLNSSATFFTNINSVTNRKTFVINWNASFYDSAGITTGGSANFQVQIWEDPLNTNFLSHPNDFPFHFEIHVQSISDPFKRKKSIGINDPSGTLRCAATGTFGVTNVVFDNIQYINQPSQTWKIYPHRLVNNSFYNVENYNYRHPQQTLSILSTEFEYWGFQPYYYSWSLFAHQLKKIYTLSQNTTNTQFSIQPYLNVFRNVISPTNSSVIVTQEDQADFIDTYSDVVLLATYFGAYQLEYSGELGLKPYILWKDKTQCPLGPNQWYDGGRLHLFARNSKPTHVQFLFSAENFWFGDYLHKNLFQPWNDPTTGMNSYDDYYFGSQLPEDKLYNVLDHNLDVVDPYNETDHPGNSYPDPSFPLKTIRQQSFSGVNGNILDGSAWFKYGIMPNASFYTQAPTQNWTYYSSVSSPEYTTLSPSRTELDQICLEQGVTITTNFKYGPLNGQYGQLWYQWLPNGIDNHKQYIPLSAYDTEDTIKVPPPPLRHSNDSYLSTLTVNDLPNAKYFIGYPVSSEMIVYGLGIAPNRIIPTVHAEILSATDADCPGFTNGSAAVTVFDDTLEQSLSSGNITWTLAGTSIQFSTNQSVSLPFTINNLSDGIWVFTVNSNGNNYDGQVTINRNNIIKPVIYAGENNKCNTDLSTQHGYYNSYQWFLNNSIPIGNTSSLTATQDGAYTVQVTRNGCTAISEPHVIQRLPVISIVGNNSGCGGITTYSINANGEKNLLYQWTIPSGTTFNNFGSIINVSWNTRPFSGGTISCIVTNECGNTVTASIEVAAFNASVVSTPTCSTLNNGTASAQIISGIGPFIYNWNNGSNGSLLTSLSAGNYNVTITDQSTSCTATATTQVVSLPNLSTQGITGSSVAYPGEQLYNITNYFPSFDSYYSWNIIPNFGSYSITFPNNNKQSANISWPSTGGSIILTFGFPGCTSNLTYFVNSYFDPKNPHPDLPILESFNSLNNSLSREPRILNEFFESKVNDISKSIIENTEIVNSYLLYPNPTTGKIKLNYNLLSTENGSLQIINALGVQVYFTKLNSETQNLEIDLSELNSAIYFFKIIVDGKQFQKGIISIVR